MQRSIVRVAVLIAVLLAVVVPSSQARQASSPVAPADPVNLPPALAQAGIAPSAWGRMVDQIRAQQPLNGCPPCEGGAVEFAEDKKLLASDGASLDNFGWSVAVWDDTIAVGAYHATVGTNDEGAVYVFYRNQGGPDNWGQVKKLVASDRVQEDQLGWSVAIWGDTIVAGAAYADIGGYGVSSDQGSAYIFERNYDPANPSTPLADNWGQFKKLTASDGAAYDHFGDSVSAFAGTIVVGARYDDVGGTDNGSAYLFYRNQGGADNWGQAKKITASDGASYDWFGHSVSIHGDTVVVGAMGDNGAYVNQGSAYLFQRNYDPANPGTPLADNWGERKKLNASDGGLWDQFGYAADIFGDIVVVGSWTSTLDSTRPNAAYIFARNQGGADNWGEVKKLSASDAEEDDKFGRSVAIWGDTILVGAPENVVDGRANQGSAYVFGRNEGGLDNWGEVYQLTATDGQGSDYFGWAIDVWGDTVVAGAPYKDLASSAWWGAAYVFSAPCTPRQELKKEIASDGAEDDEFGSSVAVWGDTLVVGSVSGDGTYDDQGAAYVFSRNQGGPDNWGQVIKLTALDGAPDDGFGQSVTLYGDVLVVGAPGAASGSYHDQGAAYVFYRNQGGADNWGQLKRLSGSGGRTSDRFGRSAALSGDTLVVGAVGANSYQGAAYVFARNQGGVDNWGEVKKLTASDGAASDTFGGRLDIAGDVILVGASGYNSYQGAAYVFYRNQGGADNWGELKKLTASDTEGSEQFGCSVGISGDTLAIGAYQALSGQGAVYLLARNQGGADNWGEVKKVTASDGAPYDQLGYSVDIFGDTLVAGAYAVDSNHGAAYLFERNQGGANNWGQASKLQASDGVEGDWFGGRVAIHGDTVLVGAMYADVGDIENQGSAYLFVCGGTGDGDVTITKAGEPGLVRLGDTLTYTLTYANNGPCSATDVVLTDTLPAGVAFGGLVSGLDGWTGPYTAGPDAIGAYTATLDACTSAAFVFTATVSGEAISADWVLTNTADIASANDLTPTNNLSQAMAVVQGLEIRKSHFPATVTAAWDFWFYIDVTNTASSPATNVVVTDTLPAGVAAYSVQPDSGGVFDGVNTVVWTIPSLGPGATIRLTIKARTYSTQAGNCLTNLAEADSEQAAPPVSGSDTICVVKGELTRPTPTPTPAATPVPPGTTVTIKKGGPGTSLDTYIYRNQPYSNYWLEPLLKVGYKQTNAALIQFDLSPIPAGAKVDKAWLEVWAAGWSGPFSNMTIGAYAISETVQISQTTWVSPELGMTWGLAGANDVVLDRRAVPESTVTTSGPLLWYRFDVARLVQEWLDGGTANNGAMLRCESCMGRVFEIKPVGPDNAGALTAGEAREPVGLGPMPGNLCPYTFFFASSEYSDPTLWPRLVVRYE